VGIIGHDNSTYAICSEPQLTTVETRIEAMSRVTANALHDVFHGKEIGDSITIFPELVVREST
jgi:DNA-binding LacI/PurR family transcriptional regulator